MTAQAHDSFRYLGEDFSIVGISGKGLFQPQDHGLKPVATSTACWRGFQCTYVLVDDRLRLSTVYVGLDPDATALAKLGKGPELGGALPRHSRQMSALGSWFYKDPAVELRYCGGLLLGADFISELYVHMGFHPAWKYRRVHELLFESGRLTKAVDRSEFMSQVRDRMSAKRPASRESGGQEGHRALDRVDLLPGLPLVSLRRRTLRRHRIRVKVFLSAGTGG
jgi:hypothetical protein